VARGAACGGAACGVGAAGVARRGGGAAVPVIPVELSVCGAVGGIAIAAAAPRLVPPASECVSSGTKPGGVG